MLIKHLRMVPNIWHYQLKAGFYVYGAIVSVLALLIPHYRVELSCCAELNGASIECIILIESAKLKTV
ncbi:MAG: hypothetical protein COW76_03785 [Shewanella sp. CG18_big_fil_WC_8_21_14_2_50_42_11]|jgi:hypothetical protein|nr:MAG: hypothetical protein COW76_03785 [Shewanella sp. CG18_big_fil_WC_8_21_14_2_50_42_11]PIX73402.1 MAG: hypothetical protein COZ42_01460 [Shewanella sp. CG_4_10_14_3_um_filter_42_91]PIY63862.1 MAG: hypothetical protein COY92_17845 [Shewanella sp. CG_4_10_14_0_8_um_filter_42_13]